MNYEVVEGLLAVWQLPSQRLHGADNQSAACSVVAGSNTPGDFDTPD
ncbi:MAG: hypothetical protein WBG92_12965 [Thiohalocapsa sp.]